MRKAFAEVKAAYLNRGAADRPGKFSAAMECFADSLRTLAQKIEPLRQQLPILHRDRELIEATAYPPVGSTAAEVFCNRFDPFFWSWAVSLAATLCLLLAVGRWRGPLFWLGAAVLVAGQAIGIVGMGLRGYITGLAPLTGMFETVEFVALYAGTILDADMRAHLIECYRIKKLTLRQCYRSLVNYLETKQNSPGCRVDYLILIPSRSTAERFLRSLSPIDRNAARQGADAMKSACGYTDRTYRDVPSLARVDVDEWIVRPRDGR